MADAIIFFLALFTLPLFPFTLVTLRLADRGPFGRTALWLLLFYVAGSLFLFRNEAVVGSAWVQVWASLSALFYAFRLLAVDDLRRFVLYYYAVLSAFAWLWHATGGGWVAYAFIHWPMWAALLWICAVLYRRYLVIHRQSIGALGNHMPAFSILFILLLLSSSLAPMLAGAEFFDEALHAASASVVIVELLAMLFLTWAMIRLFEWLIYGEAAKRRRYRQLSAREALPPLLLLGIALIAMVLRAIYGGFA